MHAAIPAKRNVVFNRAAGITQHMLAALRNVLLATVTSRPAANGSNASIQFRACAVLYLLLNDHALDRRGRCRSCMRPGAMLGQRHRKCRIHAKASFWLRQPDDVVLRHIASELNHRPAPVVLSKIPVEPRTQPLQTLATSTAPRHPGDARGTGRPEPDHGGTGEHPERLRSRRVPLDDRTPHIRQAGYVVSSGRRTPGGAGAD